MARDADDTTASTHGADAPTAVHKRVRVARPLAYSDADGDRPDSDAPARQPWWRVLTAAAVLLVSAGVISGAISIGWVNSPADQHRPPAPKTGTTTAPPLSNRPPAAAPPSRQPNPRPLQYDARGVPLLPKDPTAEEQQQVLIAILDRAGIAYSNPTAAAIDADSLCEYLSAGHRTFADLIQWVRRTHPLLTGDQPGSFVGASIGVYCRQYGYLVDSDNASATS